MPRARPFTPSLRQPHTPAARLLSLQALPWNLLVALLAVPLLVVALSGLAAEPPPTGSSVAGAPAPGQRPNVLFLLSDDQRFDTIHALGNPDIHTPNLDRLAARGTAFTRASIMGGGQPAICAPSRAMCLTGRTLFRATRSPESSELPIGAVTWPEWLRTHGYVTAGLGKWHNDRPAFARAFSTGGPVFFGGMSHHDRVPLHAFDPSGSYPATNARFAPTFSTRIFADAAVEFLGRLPTNRSPFALYVAFTAPHDPRTPPAAALERYRTNEPPLPANFLPRHPFDNGELRIRDELLLPFPRTATAVRRELALYYAMISDLDAGIGRILDALDRSPAGTNTIVIFTSDNGLAVGSHGLLGKQNLYEHSVRVPLIIAGPGLPANRRSDALCYPLDLPSTICDLATVPIPPGNEGRSLVPVLRGATNAVRAEWFGAYRKSQRALHDGRWKLIAYPASGRHQLFDLLTDPDERRDLAQDPGHAATVERLRDRLRTVQAELSDPAPAVR